MKKTKILVPAIAVLALGIAASTTATVAWYTAQEAITSFELGTGTVATKAGSTDVDDFKVTATCGNLSEIVLSNDAGETYLWDGHTNVGPVATTGDKVKALAVTLLIEYKGLATTAEQIEALYDVAFPYGVLVTAEDTSENGHSGQCLKFVANATSYVHAAENAAKVYNSDATIGFSNPTAGTGADVGKYLSSATKASAVTFYVAVKGYDNEAQDSWTYSLKVTPSKAVA